MRLLRGARGEGVEGGTRVGSAEVNLATETATVTLAAGARPEALVDAVRKAGYETHLIARSQVPRNDRSW